MIAQKLKLPLLMMNWQIRTFYQQYLQSSIS
ncbi:unnamed protein product [Acanthoscelides obtectus]|uniref:Uncharacterized protein n=1 Tax=Acanthoscelides obtectus TaxID=200917 RepID=A0A9P0QBA4_ACAOB|nr:unnamed protein product [Acanthoscelides obtectus]CAK1685326.1 hypothetical protein AOBTE_LOCUS35329 [Acanthoscelides obtectus]